MTHTKHVYVKYHHYEHRMYLSSISENLFQVSPFLSIRQRILKHIKKCAKINDELSTINSKLSKLSDLYYLINLYAD